MLERNRKPAETYPINPRFRAYGKARIDIAQRAVTREDWDRLWKRSAHPFPFSWGKTWRHCVEYKVADFPAEVGFFIDILGFAVNAFDPDYAMFTSPNGEFHFAIVPTADAVQATPPDAIRLQFSVTHIFETAVELERRGVIFEHWPARSFDTSPLLIGTFRTPNGIGIDLWCFDEDWINEDDTQLNLTNEEQSERSVASHSGQESSRDSDDDNIEAGRILYLPSEESAENLETDPDIEEDELVYLPDDNM